ncbi:DUF2182 domain-containing protein [Terriglobus saanensis]|uniref:Metal-binding integral membrane protein-like protein n=1 Tax=Terriglobus saanensis (strain ATCC BAA-1853 / DSM 23119 / SP1PR4) TaxID=401053 RepID=E8UXT9_TERSS|nr:Protein of unknown function DUF2182, transmembrane, metal-binding protein [Terriglobus saanensis SP1PR4]
MTYEAREFARVATMVGMISVAAWICLLGPGGDALVPHQHTGQHSSMLRTMPAHLFMASFPGQKLIVGWVVMFVAMMSPMLIAPICHIRLRSLKCRRVRSVGLFVVAYTITWLVLGCWMLTMAAVITTLRARSYLPIGIILAIALIWQFSPVKQCCLNGCHRYSRLDTFGLAADMDALRYGVTHAIWCIGSCWAWMLCPMLLPHGHLIAMAAIGILLFCERLEQPTLPSWRVRGVGKAARIVTVKTRIHLRLNEATSSQPQ